MDKQSVEMASGINVFLMALVLIGTIDAQGSADRFCAPTINVRKNTSVRGLTKSPLNISCPVRYCEEIPAVKWFKLDEANNRIPVNETDLITTTHSQTTEEKVFISYLNFRSVSDHDEGFYRCVASYLGSSSSSHTINVLINGSANSTVNDSKSGGEPLSWLPYIIICMGIFSLVTVVMLVTFLSLHGCICSRKCNNHRTGVPASPSPPKYDGHVHIQEEPELQKNIADSSTVTLQHNFTSQCPTMYHDNTQTQSHHEREPQQIVYATLEHLTPREAPAFNIRSREQLSEYASIRMN
ncbi:B- and T-lymphocyte attenuator-like [Hoplias malabaricus]|uniref:B- and T-lymphocyte attenuator-like n=1 Tax=Hoplias malabaricus TaxID=27720 RepID=UPI0034624142